MNLVELVQGIHMTVMAIHIFTKKLKERVILLTESIQVMTETLGQGVEVLICMLDIYIKVTCHHHLVFASALHLLDSTILRIKVVLIISHHHHM